MTEYIEREKALNALSAGQGCGVICYRAISRIPAADVVEARHGRWKREFFCNDRQLVCSLCCTTVRQPSYDPGEITPWQFCPNCGAKMDGGDEE